MRVFEEWTWGISMLRGTAVTGQTGLSVFPTETSTPALNWSHLPLQKEANDRRIRIVNCNITTRQMNWWVESPSGRNCNFVRTKESEKAHGCSCPHQQTIVVDSHVFPDFLYWKRDWKTNSCWIGPRAGLKAPNFHKTSFKHGNEDVSHGSGKPNEILRLWVAARYVLHCLWSVPVALRMLQTGIITR